MTLEQAAGEAHRDAAECTLLPACGPSTHTYVMHHSETSEEGSKPCGVQISEVNKFAPRCLVSIKYPAKINYSAFGQRCYLQTVHLVFASVEFQAFA